MSRREELTFRTPHPRTDTHMTPSRGIGGGSSPLSMMFALSLVVVDAFISPTTTFTATKSLKNSRRGQQQHSLLALLTTPSTFPTTKTSSSLAMAQRMTPTRKTRKEDSFDRSSGGDDDDDYEQEGET